MRKTMHWVSTYAYGGGLAKAILGKLVRGFVS